MANKTAIIKPYLVLCEGRDAYNFLIYLLNSKELSSEPYFSNDIQVIDFGGNNNLKNYLEVLKNADGFQNIKSLIVIRDAERNAEEAIEQVQKAFSVANLPVPKEIGKYNDGENLKTGFVLFPTCDISYKNGTLEDLCLDILAEKNAKNTLADIDEFIAKLERERNRTFPHKFKAKLHTYFSVTDKFVSLKIGEAAKAGAFDWNSKKLEPLRNFLLEAR